MRPAPLTRLDARVHRPRRADAFFSPESGFAVLRMRFRGRQKLVTVLVICQERAWNVARPTVKGRRRECDRAAFQ